MRWVAKNIVAAGLAKRCEMQVAYAIGTAKPVGLYVETFGTETVPVDRIQDAITTVFDLRPAAIVEALDLLRPIYKPTAAYGHFGRTKADGIDNGFTWERTDQGGRPEGGRLRLTTPGSRPGGGIAERPSARLPLHPGVGGRRGPGRVAHVC